jgi:exosortase
MMRELTKMTNPLRSTLFAALVVVSVAVGWRSLGGTLMLAFSSEAYTHILLILPLSCALIYMGRAALPDASGPSPRTGAALLAVALLLAGLVRWGASETPPDMRLSLSMIAVVTWWIGSVVLCFGSRAFHAFMFPLCFLYLLVPLPTFALDQATHFLQLQSALAARVLFMIAGVPVTQDGIMLSIPALDIEVARECSSIRSSAMLVITTMVLAHLFLHSNWRKGLLIAAAIPIAAMKNGLRIFVISQLGTRVDPGFFDGDLHRRGGVIFFVISLVVMTVLLWGLRRTENLDTCGPGVVSLK